MHPRGSVSRSVGRSREIVLSFCFCGWDAAKTMHEALLVVPGEVVGGDERLVVEEAGDGGFHADAIGELGRDQVTDAEIE